MKKLLIYLLCLVIVSGCGIRPFKTVDPEVGASTMTSKAGSAVPQPLSTIEEEVMPSVTPTQAITWTPNPTLTNQDAGKMVLELIETNGGCRLPCWWGITPGVTPWLEARQFLATFASSIEQGGSGYYTEDGKTYYGTNYSVYYEIPSVLERTGALISVGNGIVSSIEFGYAPPNNNYRLHRMLADYGKPGKVFIETFSNAPFYPWPFGVVLYYPEYHFIAFFEMDVQDEGDTLVGCPQKINPRLSLMEENKIITDQDVERWTIGPEPTNHLIAINEATDMSIEDFYQTYINPNTTECIKTPKEIWP